MQAKKKPNIAIVGATGAVGAALIDVLQQRDFALDKLYLLASERSAGKQIEYAGKSIVVQDIADFDFAQVEIGLFSAGAAVSRKYAPIAAAAGCVVIDNTSEFRYDDDIALVVPEVNAHALADFEKTNIIANPNCSTIQMMVALNPIHRAVGIERINVCTYQACSGTGQSAIDELRQQSAAVLKGEEAVATVYPKQIAFNVIPHIDVFEDNGYTREEMKMVWETRKILADQSILVNATAVRVPVFYGHSEALHIETKEHISAAQAEQLVAQADGVELLDDTYPTALSAAGKDAVYVGRIRQDISHPRGLNLWVVADNVRKGAATNSVQIAECLINQYYCGETLDSNSK